MLTSSYATPLRFVATSEDGLTCSRNAQVKGSSPFSGSGKVLVDAARVPARTPLVKRGEVRTAP
jgi:hypothetical protein